MQIEWTGDGSVVESVTVPPEGITIGRNRRYDIYLTDQEVTGSSPHARVTWQGADCYIIDCNSKNGTRLDGKRLSPDSPALLTPTSEIKIAKYTLKCVFSAAERPAGQQGARSGENAGERAREAGDPQDNAGRPFRVPVREDGPRVVHPTDDAPSISLEFSSGAIRVGRSKDNDIVLEDSAVSGHHAEFIPEADGYVVRDLSSKNGTFVNEKRVDRPTRVTSSDRVRIGRSRFKVPGAGHAHGRHYTQVEHLSRLKPVSDGRHIRVDAYNLKREVDTSEGHRVLLDNVSITIEPGEMVALIGESGCGKTTLMLALNGYVKADHGEVLLNGVDFYEHADMFNTSMGYVPQKDIVHEDLTVGRALWYAAELRLPPDTNAAEIESSVNRVLGQLSMAHRKDTKIAKLSGGQRKRVNIGVELLTRPSVLFLDEPTTGLDAGTEKKVTLLLRDMADSGRTIITVTHAVHTLEHYDKVIVIAPGGRLVYYGPLGPTDLKREFGIDDYADLYDILAKRGAINGSKSRPKADAAPGEIRTRQSSLAQFSALFRRYVEILAQDQRNLIQLLAQTPFVGLLIVLLFTDKTLASNIAERSPGGQNVVLLLALAIVCFCLLNSYREIIKEFPIYQRERHVSLRIWPYIFSKISALSIISLVQIVLLLLVVSARVPLNLSATDFGHMIVLMLLGAVNASLLGLMVSSLSKSSDQATTSAGLILLGQVIFCGIIPMAGDLTKGIQHICAMRWLYGGIAHLLQIDQYIARVPGAVPSDVFTTDFGTAAQKLVVLAAITLCLVWLALWAPEQIAIKKGGQA